MLAKPGNNEKPSHVSQKGLHLTLGKGLDSQPGLQCFLKAPVESGVTQILEASLQKPSTSIKKA